MREIRGVVRGVGKGVKAELAVRHEPPLGVRSDAGGVYHKDQVEPHVRDAIKVRRVVDGVVKHCETAGSVDQVEADHAATGGAPAAALALAAEVDVDIRVVEIVNLNIPDGVV